MTRFLFSLFFLLSLSACSVSQPEDTKLLLNLEKRVFSKDKIINYQVFENGLIERIITHHSSKPEELFKTSYRTLGKDTTLGLQEKIQELAALDYHNDFPWKEDFSKRATVYKFQFLKEVKTQAFNQADSKTVLVPTSYFFYSGLQEEPELFNELIKLVTL